MPKGVRLRRSGRRKTGEDGVIHRRGRGYEANAHACSSVGEYEFPGPCVFPGLLFGMETGMAGEEERDGRLGWFMPSQSAEPVSMNPTRGGVVLAEQVVEARPDIFSKMHLFPHGRGRCGEGVGGDMWIFEIGHCQLQGPWACIVRHLWSTKYGSGVVFVLQKYQHKTRSGERRGQMSVGGWVRLGWVGVVWGWKERGHLWTLQGADIRRRTFLVCSWSTVLFWSGCFDAHLSEMFLFTSAIRLLVCVCVPSVEWC